MRGLIVVCFTICIVCILAAVVVSLFLIWGSGDAANLWKSLTSICVLFLASLITIGVTSFVGKRIEEPDKER